MFKKKEIIITGIFISTFIVGVIYSNFSSINSNRIDLDLRGTSWQLFENITYSQIDSTYSKLSYSELSIDSTYLFKFHGESTSEKLAKISNDSIYFLGDETSTYPHGTKMTRYINDTLWLNYYSELRYENEKVFLIKMPYVSHNQMDKDSYHLKFLERNPYVDTKIGLSEEYILELPEDIVISLPESE